MNKNMTWGINSGVLLLVILISGCQQAPLISRPAIEIDGLILANTTSEAIYDIQMKVGNTNRLVTCSYLPASGKFTTAFPQKTYQGNPVTATWANQNRQTFSTRPIHARLPEEIDYDLSYLAVAEFKPLGVVDVYLKANNAR